MRGSFKSVGRVLLVLLRNGQAICLCFFFTSKVGLQCITALLFAFLVSNGVGQVSIFAIHLREPEFFFPLLIYIFF